MPMDLIPDEPVAFLCAVMAPDDGTMTEVTLALTEVFGEVRLQGPQYAFDMTGYYDAEMGAGLSKTILWLGPLVAPCDLAQRKRITIGLERARSAAGRRTVNVDPGLLSANSLVLATTKASGHRICIGAGLWAEVTLLFERGLYRPQPWTYRDYRRDDVGQFLLSVRQQLRQLSPVRGAAP